MIFQRTKKIISFSSPNFFFCCYPVIPHVCYYLIYKQPQNQLILRLLCTQSRDRTGMEMNPLVFETSASTNSAIWAFAVAKVSYFLILSNFF